MDPMETAWLLLKEGRQTTLGEFHPDLPSPYGPMTHYHGTTMDDPTPILREGVKPQNYPEVYLSGDPTHVSDWYADTGLFGIRPQGLPLERTPQTDDTPNDPDRTTSHVPPERLVRLTPPNVWKDWDTGIFHDRDTGGPVGHVNAQGRWVPWE